MLRPPGGTFVFDVNTVSTPMQRKDAVRSGGTAAYISTHKGHNQEPVVADVMAVGRLRDVMAVGRLREQHDEIAALKERVHELENENHELRLGSTAAADARTIEELRGENRSLREQLKELSVALELDTALRAEGPIKVDPNTFTKTRWASDLLSSRVLHRQKELQQQVPASARAHLTRLDSTRVYSARAELS
jgi:hypothetical protein